jgi:hypothetical protein
MRNIFLLICVLGIHFAALAQKNQTPWAILSGLLPGQNIRVIDSSSKKHTGTLIGVSETAISMQLATGERSIQRSDVRRVQIMANKRRARNTLVGGAVGGGIGAGVGAIIGAATHKGCSPGPFCLDLIGTGGSAGIGAAAGFLSGVIAGGIIGALVPSHTTIYDAGPH